MTKETRTPAQAEMDRLRNLEYVNRHNARMAELTRLEQAAYKARKIVGADFDPYTPQERAEAEAIRADLDALQARADRLNRHLVNRISRGTTPEVLAIGAHFAKLPGVRAELAPF